MKAAPLTLLRFLLLTIAVTAAATGCDQHDKPANVDSVTQVVPVPADGMADSATTAAEDLAASRPEPHDDAAADVASGETSQVVPAAAAR